MQLLFQDPNLTKTYLIHPMASYGTVCVIPPIYLCRRFYLPRPLYLCIFSLLCKWKHFIWNRKDVLKSLYFVECVHIFRNIVSMINVWEQILRIFCQIALELMPIFQVNTGSGTVGNPARNWTIVDLYPCHHMSKPCTEYIPLFLHQFGAKTHQMPQKLRYYSRLLPIIHMYEYNYVYVYLTYYSHCFCFLQTVSALGSVKNESLVITVFGKGVIYLKWA